MNQSLPPVFFSISGVLVFHLTGRDSSRYLHARVTNNIRDLANQRGCAAAALNPQGRTEAFGSALKLSGEEFFYICDGGDAEAVNAAFLRYKVADRLECSLLPHQTLIHIASTESAATLLPELAPITNLPEFAPIRLGSLIAFRHTRSPSSGVDVFGPTADVDSMIDLLTRSNAAPLSESSQLVGRIRSHRPAFPAELNDRGIFLESGLSHAVSFTKGCYVGQEVLEKVDSHGRLPYAIASLISRIPLTPPAAEAAINAADGSVSVGEVINAATDTEGKRVLCFARIKTSALLPNSSFSILGQEYDLL